MKRVAIVEGGQSRLEIADKLVCGSLTIAKTNVRDENIEVKNPKSAVTSCYSRSRRCSKNI